MPFQVIPRELAFFDLFDLAAGRVLRAAVDLAAWSPTFRTLNVTRSGSATSNTKVTTSPTRS